MRVGGKLIMHDLSFTFIHAVELQHHKYPFSILLHMISACPHATYMEGIRCSEMNISTARNASSKLEVIETRLRLEEATATIKVIDECK